VFYFLSLRDLPAAPLGVAAQAGRAKVRVLACEERLLDLRQRVLSERGEALFEFLQFLEAVSPRRFPDIADTVQSLIWL
jgi:hypothetical protein